MKLIVGLGNVGPHFEGTRHNVGFMALDHLAAQLDGEWLQKDKFKAAVAAITYNGEKVLLVKPLTFYNLSGEAVRALQDFYKIANDALLVIHDELALPFGVVRTRLGGSDAGNNGIKSVMAHCGSDFARVRIGVANDMLEKMDAADFVLARLNRTETAALPETLGVAQKAAEDFMRGQFAPTTFSEK